MVYVILSKVKTDFQKKVIRFVRMNVKFNSFHYKIIYKDKFIPIREMKSIHKQNDLIIWEPIMAYHNLEIIKFYSNSIVILERPTVYLQKVSILNPINENLAINHGFYIMYIRPDIMDITNDEWRHVINNDVYIVSKESLVDHLNGNSENIKNEKLIVPEYYLPENKFFSKNTFLMNQVNLTGLC